jgi:hypothetical protein
MNDLQPLHSSLGAPAEGPNKFFLRDKIVKKIHRRLSLGENLLLSAPRRIGKSSILKHIKQNPQADQIILYIAVMSVDSSEEFFKKLFNELIKNEQIFAGLKGYFTRASNTLKKYASRISGFSIAGKVTVDSQERINYYHECQQLFEVFVGQSKKIIVFIDELPDALTNIAVKDKTLAIRFLQQNRDLRMDYSHTGLQFIYTGSTGLKNIVKKLDKLDLVNDLADIKVPPLSKDEAKTLLLRLTLGFKQHNSDFDISDTVIDYILDKITWRLPYYMQIIAHELFEYFDEQEQTIETTTVDFILSEIVKSKSSHADYFENWKRRLKAPLEAKEYDFVIEILNYIAVNDHIEYAVFHDLAVKNSILDARYILDVLEHDGYISEQNTLYGFNSFLLKEWWYINVAT